MRKKKKVRAKKVARKTLRIEVGKKRKNKVQYQKTFIISSWIDGCK